MAPKKHDRWHRRPKRRSLMAEDAQVEELPLHDDAWHTVQNTVGNAQDSGVGSSCPFSTAADRLALYARLAWSTDGYNASYDLELAQNEHLVSTVTPSAYMQRKIALQHAEESKVATTNTSVAGHLGRMREAGAALARASNVQYVPFSQAVKAVVFLASCTNSVVWEAERKKRLVVDRTYAIRLLQEMLKCRPLPAFEVDTELRVVSIGFDQTYAKAGGTTGISKYSGIQTVDEQGNCVNRERMVYINGQHYPTPAVCASLSARRPDMRVCPAAAERTAPHEATCHVGQPSTRPSPRC